jgi:3-deoxy-manno-octulosonate cytidylyltransferase (CMP-KDO synthetase)
MTPVVLIPARYESSRFPGKPLVPILGVPMIVRVARQAAAAVGAERVYIATDDDQIADVVRTAGFRAIATSRSAATGTDRIAEAAEAIEAELYINVQGDEPMLDPTTIDAVIRAKRAAPGLVINAMAKLGSDEDPHSLDVPKVVANESGRLLYMSRSALPGFKDPRCAPATYRKQVCVYGFEREQLRAFAGFGRKSQIEASEDIEILRFFELGIAVQMIEVSGGTLAVDVPDDVRRVEAAMRARGLT